MRLTAAWTNQSVGAENLFPLRVPGNCAYPWDLVTGQDRIVEAISDPREPALNPPDARLKEQQCLHNFLRQIGPVIATAKMGKFMQNNIFHSAGSVSSTSQRKYDDGSRKPTRRYVHIMGNHNGGWTQALAFRNQVSTSGLKLWVKQHSFAQLRNCHTRQPLALSHDANTTQPKKI